MLRRRLATPIVICALPLALAACGEKTLRSAHRSTAGARRNRSGGDSRVAFVLGTVAARVQGDLGFRVPGKLLERLVDAGQTVKRGQPLMRIDPSI